MKIPLLSNRLPALKILDQIIEINYLAIVFLIPIWFAYFLPTYNIFEFNKIIVFRSLVWTLIFLTSLKIIFFPGSTILAAAYKKFRWRTFKTYFLISALLVVGSLVALFFSIDYKQSFFGSYDRWQGVSSYIFYFLWFFLMFINLSSKNREDLNSTIFKLKINRIIVISVLSAAVVAIYGILQILNLDFLSWPEAPHLTGRALSTMGQPNFLASFLLLTIPLSIYLFIVSRHFFSKSVYTLVTFLQLTCLFMTSSRGGFLALILTIIIFVAYLFFVSNLKRRIKWGIVFVSLLIGLSGIAIIEVVTPGRLSGSFDISAGSFAARINFFQAAADSIIDRPVFGYGPENSGEIFIKYYERDWGAHANVGANTDRAHNIVLDIILNLGLVGLLLFSLWYYSFFKLAFIESKSVDNKPLALALAFGALGYLISLLFSFSIVATEVYFWLFFVLLASLNFHKENTPLLVEVISNDTLKKRRLKLILASVIFIICIWQIAKNMESLIADAYLNDIYITMDKGELVQVVVLHGYINELKINPVQANFGDYFVGDYLSNQYDRAPDASAKFIVKNRLAEIFVSLPDYGYENLLLKAKIASRLENYQVADEYFALVVKQAPYWPIVYFEMGQDFFRRGDMQQAEEAYKLLDINLPDLNSDYINDPHRKIVNYYKHFAYNNLGDIYFAKKEYRSALKFFNEAYKNLPSDYSLLKKIADSFYLQGDVVSALKYVNQGAIFSPTDYNWQVALASLYFEQGNQEEALIHINEAIKLAPEREEIKKIQEKYKN
jgi:putative inorganic carbon (HCO3(-)) transporter